MSEINVSKDFFVLTEKQISGHHFNDLHFIQVRNNPRSCKVNLSLEAFINKILKIFERTMKCNVTNVYEISHIWELRKWNQVKNVPCSCERNVSLKKKEEKTGFRWSSFEVLIFFSDFLRNYINLPSLRRFSCIQKYQLNKKREKITILC